MILPESMVKKGYWRMQLDMEKDDLRSLDEIANKGGYSRSGFAYISIHTLYLILRYAKEGYGLYHRNKEGKISEITIPSIIPFYKSGKK